MFRRWWWVFLVMAGIGAACGVIVAGIATYLMPKGYESQAVIEVKPVHGETFSCEAEIKTICGPEILGRVVSKLELDTIWQMPSQGVIGHLREVVKCARVPDTNRIAISVRLLNKFEAMDVVNELAAAFKAEREKFPEIMAKHVADLDRQVMAQFDKLENMDSQRQLGSGVGTAIDWRKASVWERPDLEPERQKYEALTAELEAATTDARAQSAGVILRQAGTVQELPATPNVTLNLAIGKLLGCLLSPLFAMPIIMLLHRRIPQPRVAAPSAPSDHSRKDIEKSEADW